MKVAITITVEIEDPKSWPYARQAEPTEAEVRADVKSYVGNSVQNLAAWDEVKAEVKYR